ncbi:MAG: hypothetical protein HQL53_10735 [Magnetococcales bacterium]|nr:hypothetical protein [Magnetococcales bacterium]
MNHAPFLKKSGPWAVLMIGGLLVAGTPQSSLAAGFLDAFSGSGGDNPAASLFGGIVEAATGGDSTESDDTTEEGGIEGALEEALADMANAKKVQEQGQKVLASTLDAHNRASLILMGARDASQSILEVVNQLQSNAPKISSGLQNFYGKMQVTRGNFAHKQRLIKKYRNQSGKKVKSEALVDANSLTGAIPEMKGLQTLIRNVGAAQRSFQAQAASVALQGNQQKMRFFNEVVTPINDSLAFSSSYLEETLKHFPAIKDKLTQIDRDASQASDEVFKLGASTVASLTLKSAKLSGALANLKSDPIGNLGEIQKLVSMMNQLGDYMKTIESHNSKIREANGVLAQFIATMTSSEQDFINVVQSSKGMLTTVDQVTETLFAATSTAKK